MKRIYTTTLILLTAITAYTQVYYVAPGGAALLSTNINAPGSLTFAVANAVAGDTVWVKTGNYGALNLEFQNSGTATNPIQFIGYKNTIGGIDSSAIPTSIAAYTTGNYSADFPTLNGVNRAVSGTAIKLYQQHVKIKNFHILNYQHAIDVWGGQNTEIENIVVAYLGNTSVYYNGYGISIGNSSNSTIKYCFVYNSAAEGIKVYSSGNGISTGNLISKCSVFCDDNSTQYSSTDYYIYMSSLNNAISTGNVLEYCHVERVGNLTHTGHGYSFITYGTASTNNNTIRNCINENVGQLVLIRGPETTNNHFTKLKSTNGGIHISSGKSNLFEKIEINGNNWTAEAHAAPIVFYMDTLSVPGYPRSAIHKIFSNCLFKDCPVGISLSYYMGTSGGSYAADSNKIINCTFAITDTNINSSFVTNQRANNGNTLINCIISGYKKYELQPTHWASSQPTLLNFENCCIYGNNFTQGNMTNATLTNCIFINPEFVNPTAGDFHLQATSPCIDTGKVVSLTDDFEGNQRPCNNQYDIGAYEFQGANYSAIKTIANVRAITTQETVRTRGIITRAYGRFIYIQDATGAIGIRQASGAMVDSITVEKLKEGDSVIVVGPRNEYNNYAQIQLANGAYNDTNTVIKIASNRPLPSVQTLTIQQLLANPEAYESELIRINNLKINGTGNFTASTNYKVWNAANPNDSTVLRIVASVDTEIDDAPALAIPVDTFDFQGILIQFCSSPTNGCTTASSYQLQGTRKTDIIPQAVLPVKWLEVKAFYENEDVKVLWQTASEVNNEYFDIERSADEVYFSSIGKVKGAGNTAIISNYTFMDKNPLNTTVVYYRIKQTDFDGKFDYSKIIAINRQLIINNQQLIVFPNPANNEITLKNIPANGARIIDITGKTLMQIPEDGTYNVREIKAGMYFIFTDSNTIKLIIE